MSMKEHKRLNQLKFIANIFSMSLKEIKEIMGFETLTMIFRRVGEATGINVVKRFQGKYTNLEEFSKLLLTGVIDPVLGQGKGTVKAEGNKILITMGACPYKIAGFPIKEMSWFCEYTEGLFESAIREAFPSKKVETKCGASISKGNEDCNFEITST